MALSSDASTTTTPTPRASPRASPRGEQRGPARQVELESHVLLPRERRAAGRSRYARAVAGVVDVQADDGGPRVARAARPRRPATGELPGRDRLGAALRPHAAAHRPAHPVGRVRARARRGDAVVPPGRGAIEHRAGDRRRGLAAGRSHRGRGERRGVAGPRDRAPLDRRRGREAVRAAQAAEGEGRIRIVEIPDWDVSACGGTHTLRTGEVGVIKIDALGEGARQRAASSSCAARARCTTTRGALRH